MENLFKRMEEEQLNCVVLKNWYSEFKASIVKCQFIHERGEIFIDSKYYERANELYENLCGALWGFEIVGYISDELRDKYICDLMAVFSF